MDFPGLILSFILYLQFLPIGYSGKINWNVYIKKLCESDPLKVVERNGKSEVQVAIKIYDLYNIDERNMEFSLRTSLLLVWKDSSVNLSEVEISHPEFAPVRVEQCVWKPDIVFYNSKEAALYNVDSPSKFLKVLPGGYFYRWGMYRTVISCPMDFHRFPMDVQHCAMEIGPIATPAPKQRLKWMRKTGTGPLHITPIRTKKIKALQFTISAAVPHQYYETGVRLQANLTFTRRLTSSLVNSYLPSGLVVSLSWMSFWLDPNAVPGRVTLGVTSFLALATQMVHSRSSLPSLDYMTALDIWFGYCLLMVFASLVEFTLANKLDRKPRKEEKSVLVDLKEQLRPPYLVSQDFNKIENLQTRRNPWILRNWCNTGCIIRLFKKMRLSKMSNSDDKLSTGKKENPIDVRARIIFPICGVIFTITYWVHYLC